MPRWNSVEACCYKKGNEVIKRCLLERKYPYMYEIGLGEDNVVTVMPFVKNKSGVYIFALIDVSSIIMGNILAGGKTRRSSAHC